MILISFMKNIISNFSSTLEYKTIISYLFIGSLFTATQFTGSSYMEVFMGALTNKIFMVVILYPSFIAMFITIYRYIGDNQMIITRLNNRKKFAIYSIISVIFMTIFLLLHELIIMGICANSTMNSGFQSTRNLEYNVSDFIVYIVCLIKIILTICTIGFVNLVISFKYNKKNISVIILMACLTIIFFGEKFYPSGIKIIDIFNPGFHSNGYALVNNIYILINNGIIYFTCIITILLILIFRYARITNLGMVYK